ncbi:MAG: helix-turn-helix transcriptional regulator [Rhodoplanes sp.]
MEIGSNQGPAFAETDIRSRWRFDDLTCVIRPNQNDIPADIGRVLEGLRLRADRKQSDIAQALGIHPSRVSRLETGATDPDPVEIEKYLAAIASEAAQRYRDILAEEWTNIPRPDPWHPDAPALVQVTRLLRKLNHEVISDPKLPAIPRRPSSFSEEPTCPFRFVSFE